MNPEMLGAQHSGTVMYQQRRQGQYTERIDEEGDLERT